MGNLHTVLSNRRLTDNAFVLRFARNGIVFEPGQHLTVGMPEDQHARQYSICSGQTADHLEILVKKIDHGAISPQLFSLEPGQQVLVSGPQGYFVLPEGAENERFVLIATGTGIAPYHSFVRTHPHLNCQVLHGVRYESERYLRENFPSDSYKTFVSRGEGGHYRGRVTEYLKKMTLKITDYFYLCGNSDMIYEAMSILSGREVPRNNIRAEVYF